MVGCWYLNERHIGGYKRMTKLCCGVVGVVLSAIAFGQTTITSGPTNQNIVLAPNGTGIVQATPFSATAAEIGSIGPYGSGSAPICFVDGFVYTNISACITYLQTTLGLNGGTIVSRLPEDLPIGVFAIPNWHGTVILGNGTTNSGNCSQTAPFNCWMTQGPLLLPDELKLIGVQPANLGFSNSRGTVISFDSGNFPSPLKAATAPTLACDSTAGSIASGTTIYVQIDESNNLLDNSNNANAQATPGHSAVSTEVSKLLNSTNCTGTGPYEVTFTAPGQLTSSNALFDAVDVGVYSATTSGQELENKSGTDLTCPTAGVVDTNGCNGFTGTIKITNIPSVEGAGGRTAPCYRSSNHDATGFVTDCSNPLVYVGVGVPGVAGNAFEARVEHLMLLGSPTGATTILTNEPAIGVLNGNGQENSGVDDVIVTGAFGSKPDGTNVHTAMVYFGFDSANSYIRDLHVPSNSGPSTSCMVDLVIDGRIGTTGTAGARLLENASLNGNNATGGCPGSSTSSYRMLVTGQNADIGAKDLHIEAKGDGIFVDNVAGGVFHAESCTQTLGYSCMHFSASADISEGFVGKQGDTHPSFTDDTCSPSCVISPPGGKGFGAAYSMRPSFGAINLNNMLLSASAPTIAAGGCGGAAASIPTNNGTGAFTVNVGTMPTAGGCTVTMPAAKTDWVCSCTDRTTNSTLVFACKQSNTTASTTSVTLTNYSDVAVATPFVAIDVLRVSCNAY